MADRGLRPFDRGSDTAGNGDVVVLDQDRRTQRVAMIVSAAAAHGVALERSQARRGLARIGDSRARSGGQRGHVTPGLRGDAAHALGEIQRRPLRHQHRSGRTFDYPDRIARLGQRAVGQFRFHLRLAELHLVAGGAGEVQRLGEDRRGAAGHDRLAERRRVGELGVEVEVRVDQAGKQSLAAALDDLPTHTDVVERAGRTNDLAIIVDEQAGEVLQLPVRAYLIAVHINDPGIGECRGREKDRNCGDQDLLHRRGIALLNAREG